MLNFPYLCRKKNRLDKVIQLRKKLLKIYVFIAYF